MVAANNRERRRVPRTVGVGREGGRRRKNLGVMERFVAPSRECLTTPERFREG